MSEKKLNLWQKLIEIRKVVAYLKKDKRSYNYDYATPEAVLGAIVPLLNDHGILLKSEVIGITSREITNSKGKIEMIYTVPMRMTWINAENPEEREEVEWGGVGCNGEEKGYGSALTYAERYFMLKEFNIATGKDDPDNYENTTRNYQEAPQQATTPPVAATNGTKPESLPPTPPDPAKWDEHIEKQKMFRKLADDYTGAEILAMPTMPDMSDEHTKMMVKDKRTAAEKKSLVKAYIATLTVTKDDGSEVPLSDKGQQAALYALSVFKDNAGFYGGIKTWDALDDLKDDKKLNMLYTAAKGAAIHAAQVAANKV